MCCTDYYCITKDLRGEGPSENQIRKERDAKEELILIVITGYRVSFL